MFTADEWFFENIDDDAAFRVANYVVRLSEKSGYFYGSMQTIGESCWPKIKKETQRSKAAKAIRDLVSVGLISKTEKKLAGGVVVYKLMVVESSPGEFSGVVRNPPGGGENPTTDWCESHQGVVRNPPQYRELRKELRKEEEESKTLLLLENKGAKLQGTAAPRAGKEKLTSQQLEHLRQLCSQIYDLREDPHKRPIGEVLQIGCDKFGYEGLVELIKCIRHDPLMSASPEHRTLAYAYNTHQRVLEAGRDAFEAEMIRRQQLDEKMAQEAAQRAREQEYLQSEEHKRAMEETRAFIDAKLKTQKWFLDSQAENNVA